jgi:hypothetical protein
MAHTLSFFQPGISTVSHQRITLTEVIYEAARDEGIRWRQIRHSNILSIRDNAVAGCVAHASHALPHRRVEQIKGKWF